MSFDNEPSFKDIIYLNLYALSKEKPANEWYIYLFITYKIWNVS